MFCTPFHSTSYVFLFGSTGDCFAYIRRYRCRTLAHSHTVLKMYIARKEAASRRRSYGNGFFWFLYSCASYIKFSLYHYNWAVNNAWRNSDFLYFFNKYKFRIRRFVQTHLSIKERQMLLIDNPLVSPSSMARSHYLAMFPEKTFEPVEPLPDAFGCR